MRQSVRWFAEQMETKLRENDHKGGWSGCTKQYLADKLAEEVNELLQAMHQNKPMMEIVREAADVANIAHMIAENEANELWPKYGYVIQDIETGQFLKHDGSHSAEHPYIYVDRADKAENYETLAHACYVACRYADHTRKWRVIDFDNGGIGYVKDERGRFVMEGPSKQ